MQSVLQMWKIRCNEASIEGDVKKVPVPGPNDGDGQKEGTHRSKSTSSIKASTPKSRKGKSMDKILQQGQISIKSFLEHKNMQMTPSISTCQNSSIINNSQNTTVAGSSKIYLGEKTIEASEVTGGRAKQLSGSK